MGIARTTVECGLPEIEEFRQMIRRFNNSCKKAGKEEEVVSMAEEAGERMVCVTSGISYLGLWITKELLHSGFSVRLALENQEDLEKLREVEAIGGRNRVFAVIAKTTELENLVEAFDGCNGVFHTSSFTDPAGVSGYSKYMAELEIKAAETVIEACSRTSSVRKCVFTSSLLACIWRDSRAHTLQPILDENCWSEESLCREKKLWFALGKMKAEKAAWNKARERNVNMVTICPALVTGPGFPHRNSTGSIAYLKGAREMYAQGLLATVNVKKLAEAHMRVYEAMEKGACGRYICFERVIGESQEAAELARRIGMPDTILSHAEREDMTQFNVSNTKLARLLLVTSRCSDAAF